MQYLTTHDLAWINTIVTGETLRYNYVTLEAAMAGQYNYGDSNDVPGQAAILLERLLLRPPFAYGNRRTAFIALLTFLNANGYATRASDAEAAQNVAAVAEGRLAPVEAVAQLATPANGTLPMGLTLRKLIAHECNLHADALRVLAAGD